MTSPSPHSSDSESRAHPSPTISSTESERGSEISSGLQRTISNFEEYVKLVAENLRYGSWTKRLVTLAGVMSVSLNPISANKVVEAFGFKELPKWYVTLFWSSLGSISLGTVALAVATLPKKANTDIDLSSDQSGAIKGLLSFELKDAEIFSKLERRWDIRDCWASVTSPDFRLGILMGESGCGKSSLLQAGLLPRLLEDPSEYYGVYVKFGDHEPIAAIRASLGDLLKNEDDADLKEMLDAAALAAQKPIALLFDQFEQFFVQYKQQEQRVSFIQSLKRWYDSDSTARVLIGIRGDLADRLTEIQKVLGYSLGPREVFRLEKFSPNEAAKILEVMAETEGLLFDERFITELTQNELANKEDGLISPVDVQVLGWMIARQSDEELRAFDRRAFQRLGGVEGLLQRFLERTLNKRVGQIQRELTIKILLALIDRERNVRAGALSLESIQTQLKGNATNVDITEAVEWLSRSDVRLVKIVNRKEERAYEIAHERLISALLRVAKQELSEREQANQLLDRRVNEWLGNGKSKRYLFSWRELRLLHRYQKQDALLWGAQRTWKEQLLLLSHRRIRFWVSLISAPVFISLAFFIWSQTTPGTMQWVRWQIILAGKKDSLYSYRGSLGDDGISIERALTADLVTGVKQNPFPKFWIRWFSQELYDRDSLKEIVDLATELDSESSQTLLNQVYTVAQASRPYALLTGIETAAAVATSYSDLAATEEAEAVLIQSMIWAESLADNEDKSIALVAISDAYEVLNDKEKPQEILLEAVKNTLVIESDKTKALRLIEIAEAYAKLDDNNNFQKTLSQAIEITKAINNLSDKVEKLSQIADAYITAQKEHDAKAILLEALEISGAIRDESSKASALYTIARTYGGFQDESIAKEGLFQVLKLSASMKEESSKVDVINAIAGIYIEDEEKIENQGVLLETLNLAETIAYEEYKAEVLETILKSARSLEDDSELQKSLSRVLDLAKEMNGQDNKISLLNAAVETSKNLSDDKAQTILTQALEIATSTESRSSKISALLAISKAYGQLEKSAEAQKNLFQVLVLTSEMESAQSKVFALKSAAEASQSVLDVPESQEVLHRISDLADSIEREDLKVDVMMEVAKAYAVLGKDIRVQETLFEALQLAESIEKFWLQYDALKQIAEASMSLQTNSKKEEVLSHILNLVDELGYSWYEIEILETIAKVYIDTGNLSEARRILKTSYKSKYSCPLNKIYSLLGEFNKAFQSAQKCSVLGREKVIAWSTILTIHAEQINPELKKLREKSVKTMEDD